MYRFLPKYTCFHAVPFLLFLTCGAAMKTAFTIISVITSLTPGIAEMPITAEIGVEAGFPGIMKHEIQAGPGSDKGDVFDYRTQGNQGILFHHTRFQIDFELYGRHHAILLYQPLNLDTCAAGNNYLDVQFPKY